MQPKKYQTNEPEQEKTAEEELERDLRLLMQRHGVAACTFAAVRYSRKDGAQDHMYASLIVDEHLPSFGDKLSAASSLIFVSNRATDMVRSARLQALAVVDRLVAKEETELQGGKNDASTESEGA